MKFLGLLLAVNSLAAAAFGWQSCCDDACCDDWCGFYVGINAGAVWGDGDVKMSTGPSADDYLVHESVVSVNENGKKNLNDTGFVGGGQIGYNWQICSWVLGLETDFNAFTLNKSREITVPYPTVDATYTIDQEYRTNWLYTLRPRLGWACDCVLLYATGGLALTQLKYQGNFSDTFPYALAHTSAKFDKTATGWTVGAGLEYAFSRCFTVKLEYLYVDFGSQSTNSTLTATGTTETNPFHHSVDLTGNVARIGINYRL